MIYARIIIVSFDTIATYWRARLSLMVAALDNFSYLLKFPLTSSYVRSYKILSWRG